MQCNTSVCSLIKFTQVFLIAKDFGARPAYTFALLHPERVLGVVTMGVPYMPPGPRAFEKLLPEGFYISRWQVLCAFSWSWLSVQCLHKHDLLESLQLTVTSIVGAWPGRGWFWATWCENSCPECLHPVLQKWNTNSCRKPGDHGLGGSIYPSSPLVQGGRSCSIRSFVWEIGLSNCTASSI